MGFFFTKFFWGGLLICYGIIMILEKLFKLNIPFGRFLIAFLLIYGGVYLITRTTKQKKVNIDTRVFTTKSTFHSENNKEYSVVFGSNIIDLSDYSQLEPIQVNTVFGTSDVLLSKEKTYIINVNAAFAETILPNQKELWLGTGKYVIGDASRENKINIELNTVFGSSHVKFKNDDVRPNDVIDE